MSNAFFFFLSPHERKLAVWCISKNWILKLNCSFRLKSKKVSRN